MICIGDSLTLGMIGHSYINYCKPRSAEQTESAKQMENTEQTESAKQTENAKQMESAGESTSAVHTAKILNKGVNGDTTRCAFERLERYLANPSNGAQDTYVVAIGTNDILLPYLARISTAWKAETSLRCRIKKCIDEDEIFRQEYEKYFMAIGNFNREQWARKRGEKQWEPKKMITIGLPYIELEGYPLDTVCRHNEIIRQLSEKYGVPYIDMYKMQCAAVGYNQDDIATAPIRLYTWKHKNIIRLIDNLVMLICPSVKDHLSKMRGLKLTVDGVHYNSLSAGLLGKTLSEVQGQYPQAHIKPGEQN